jgi:hypothetical protein
MLPSPTLLARLKRLPLLLRFLLLFLVLLIIGTSVWGAFAFFHHNAPQGKQMQQIPVSVVPHKSTPSAVKIQVAGPVSPYIFGTNLAMFDTRDQMLNSPTAQALLGQLHATIIRMPVRLSLPETTEIQAAQIIKNVGAVPLLVLHGASVPTALPDDLRIIQDMNQLFGNSTVYYEFGNEDDLQGISAQRYVAAWNAVVPQLKKAALNGKFIGPVNYKYEHNYLNYFLQHAQPLPDAVSWHEYTCDVQDSDNTCIEQIADWTTHISDARISMMQAVGTTLPIMITEWNYAPNSYKNDGKNNDPAFMKLWTTQAIQTLAANRIFAAMQYSCTSTAMSLINDANQLTTQGQTFQAQYETIIVQNEQPAPVASLVVPTPTPTQSVAFNGPIAFSFEDGGTDGWAASGQGITGLQNSTDVALDGSHSLEVSLSNISSQDFPYILVDLGKVSSPPQPGQTVSAYVYLPSNAVSLTAKLFVAGRNYQWSWDAVVPLQPGTWTHLTCDVPSTDDPPRQLGIQFNSRTGNGVGTQVYVDAVGWG